MINSDSGTPVSDNQAIQVIKRSFLSLPWYAQSSLQGLLTGFAIAQGGMGALWTLWIFPFLDYSALSRIKFLRGALALQEKALRTSPSKRPDYDKDISWLSYFRPIASISINAVLAASTAPLLAPYSPFSQPTRNFYHKVASQPVTYSTLDSLDESTDFLLQPNQAFWLHKPEVAKLRDKQHVITAIKAQRSHDIQIKSDAKYVLSTPLNDASYQRILDTVKSLQSDSRFKIVLTKSSQNLVNAVRPKAQEYANDVDRRKKEEEARQAALVAAEKLRWGLYYENSELKDSAIRACKNAAFEKTGQSKHWLFDDRGLDFNIAPVGGKIWVGGPFKVEIARGNIDGSKRAIQVGVDCYFDKNSAEASGTIQVDW